MLHFKVRYPQLLALILLLAAAVFPAVFPAAFSALAQEETQEETQAETGAGADRVEAVAYRPIEPNAALLVQPETQSEMDDEALRFVAEWLAAKGHRPDNRANLVLTVATQLVTRSGDAGTNGVEGGSNVYNSGGRSLLNPNRPLTRTDRVFRIYLSVHERSSGLYSWRGMVERGDPEHDPAASLPTMLPELLAHFGETYSTK